MILSRPIHPILMSISAITKKTESAINMEAILPERACRLLTFLRIRFRQLIKPMIPSNSILIILLPYIFSAARSGISWEIELIEVSSSGIEVVPAIRSKPIKIPPSFVLRAITSPYSANFIAAVTISAEYRINKKQTIKNFPIRRFVDGCLLWLSMARLQKHLCWARLNCQRFSRLQPHNYQSFPGFSQK